MSCVLGGEEARGSVLEELVLGIGIMMEWVILGCSVVVWMFRMKCCVMCSVRFLVCNMGWRIDLRIGANNEGSHPNLLFPHCSVAGETQQCLNFLQRYSWIFTRCLTIFLDLWLD